MPLEIPSGSITVMRLNTPPTGWTKTNTFNLHVLRATTGAVSSGGTLDYTSVFVQHTSTYSSVSGSVNGTTLTAASTANHTHPAPITGTVLATSTVVPPVLSRAINAAAPNTTSMSNGSSDPHTHPMTVGVPATISPSNGINLNVRYVDIIFVQRS